MRGRSRLHRMIASIALICSAASSLLIPIADARAELQSVGAQSHVESPGSGNCPEIHDHDCQLCHVVRLTPHLGHVGPDIAAFESAASNPPVQPVRVSWRSALFTAESPRAPPAA